MYKSLQAGRAIAAMLVVLFHLGGNIAKEKYFGIQAFSIPFSFGSAGVEFFFVLSGFIIFTAHRNDIFQPHKLASYIRKRLTRIYPTYWIIFLSVFFLAIASTALRNTVPHDLFLILKSLFLIPQDKDIAGGTGAPVLIVAWTLQYEMLFYFYFAFLILSRWLSIFMGLTLLYLYINYAGVPSLSFPLSFLLQDYLLLFAMGMFVSAVCTTRKIAADRPFFYVVIGSMLFLLIALDNVTDVNLLKEWRIILYGFASSLIIFGLVQAEKKGQIIGGHKLMQVLGDSSYALYLIHFPLISILCKLSISIQLNKLGIIGALISYITIFGMCLLSSVVFHLRIEKPVIAYLQREKAGLVYTFR
ncbi:MAG: acyltransferase [Methylococcales bacterium]|nr:acyltransferase [Methylococcales bacterium]